MWRIRGKNKGGDWKIYSPANVVSGSGKKGMGYSVRLLVKKKIEEKSTQELSLEIGGRQDFLYFFSPVCSAVLQMRDSK